jgi:hypothetical protein
MDSLGSVENKGLTKILSSAKSTLMKNIGGGGVIVN